MAGLACHSETVHLVGKGIHVAGSRLLGRDLRLECISGRRGIDISWKTTIIPANQQSEPNSLDIRLDFFIILFSFEAIRLWPLPACLSSYY